MFLDFSLISEAPPTSKVLYLRGGVPFWFWFWPY